MGVFDRGCDDIIPAIGSDGTIFFGSGDGKLYAVQF